MKKIIFLFFFYTVIICAQELEATVEINTEQLPVAARERLENFKYQIQDYLNNNKFTRQPWEGEKIKCNFNIFFTGADNEISYGAQLVVVSQRPIEGTLLNSLMINILDNSWLFQYEKNQSMYFQQTDFNPLTSLLDFYAYIIIGFDMDSYYRLGGTEYFSKALEIAVRGGSTKFSEGWQSESSTYNRRGLVDDLVNAKFQQLRSDIFDYHYNGIDIYNTEEKQTAIKNISKLVLNLYKIKDQISSRSVFMKVFFDAKAGEIAQYLKDYPDKEIYNYLKKLDPPHISKYDEALK